MDGVGLEDGDAWVAGELFFEVGGEGWVELEENELGVGIHSFDNLSGMAPFAWAELDDHTRARKVEPTGRLAGQKGRARNNVSDTEGVNEDAAKK